MWTKNNKKVQNEKLFLDNYFVKIDLNRKSN